MGYSTTSPAEPALGTPVGGDIPSIEPENVSRMRLTMPAVYMPLAGVMSAVNSPGQAREKYLCRIATKSDYLHYDYESARAVDDQTSAADNSSCRKQPQLDISNWTACNRWIAVPEYTHA
ncbi:hypothetical protein COL5a_004301 [Colletotrichum fioriniae]|uniref:uncharacterized protein n=1 Tax=Colletotrichum fioriniae TaxID=710243 RepID=UPI0032DB4899|nr:hypothetical protein COL5a_004301 [Colletotrichum fioriniae]KAJ3938213.1 hypothetical protein N0V96_011902 [Colletotrichum fioriniae]